MKRRDFLKATLVAAGAVLVGCDDGEGGNTADAMTDQSTDSTPGDGPGPDTVEPQTLEDTYFPQSLASGDPRDTSVILWTRVTDPDRAESDDLEIVLEVATDEAFTELIELNGGGASLTLSASASADHCVKVRLTDLTPRTHYWYRFTYHGTTEPVVTRIGRTKTAPAPDDNAPISFMYASCQDYNGRYYNSYRELVRHEADFVVHLGDYVYETTGNPEFQTTTPDRVITFRDEAGAILIGAGTDDEHHAAKSLSNYRDLYRVHRSDRWLQAAHERFPFIVGWDDHEFSDDSYGANATYFDGAQDEHDEPRRKAANQAWFEYMPVEYADPDFQYDPAVAFPDDLTIYRSIRYGSLVELFMTDLRTYRADHVIDEATSPGAVLLTEAELTTESGGTLPDWADPYLDVDTYDGGSYAAALVPAADSLDVPAANIAGPMSATYLNRLVESFNETAAAGSELTVLDDATLMTLERGLTGLTLNKQSTFGALGSRYFTIKDPFHLYARWRYQQSAGASEDMLGAEQETWLIDGITSSGATWKVLGTAFLMFQRSIDVTNLDAAPESLRSTFLFSAEDWDGCPNKRTELIEALAPAGNVIAISGDMHSFGAALPMSSNDQSVRLVEFAGGSITSATYRELAFKQLSRDPDFVAGGVPALALALQTFMDDRTYNKEPGNAFWNVEHNGFVRVEVSSSEYLTTFHMIPLEHVTTELDEAGLDEAFFTERFRVDSGSSELYHERDGNWVRWDPTTESWV